MNEPRPPGRRCTASIEIAAGADAVWAVLVDTDNYPAIDPTCARVLGGPAEDGAVLRFYSTLAAPERPLRLRVLAIRPPHDLVLVGALGFGLVEILRAYTIKPLTLGAVRLQVTEEIHGQLWRLFAARLPDMTEAFAGFCRGLKEMAEVRGAMRRDGARG